MQGIDVSKWQGNIDWKKVKGDGVEFAVIKATQGRGETFPSSLLKHFVDSKFYKNIVDAHNVGLDTSVYHYLTATNKEKSIEEAQYFLEIIKPYRSYISSFAVCDVESDYLNGIKPQELEEIVDAFLGELYSNGYQPLVYTNPSFIKYRFPPNFANEHDFMLAHYNTPIPYAVPNIKIWQYGKGNVDGVIHYCDLDIGYYEKNYIPPKYKVGDKYIVQRGDIYTNNIPVPSWLFGKELTVIEVKDNSILLAEIMSWIKI